MSMVMKHWVKIALIAGAALFVLIQLIPYGHSHNNPPVTQAAKFPTAQGEQLMTQSCGDCHTNLTTWRWYSNIAPASWLVTQDVNGGREKLNFSEWNKPQPALHELIDQVQSGEMPPIKYTLPHPSAKLSATEKKQLIADLTALYKTDPPTIKVGGGG
jgi:mono/diheme cytochrome c family protein